jgi:hypothetical protein
MTLYDDYRNTDYLDDLSFIAGSEISLYFPILDESGTQTTIQSYGGASLPLLLNGSPLNVNGASLKWALSIYGQPDFTILEKDATVYDSNTFVVALTEDDTINLGGEIYLQQMRLTDSTGKRFRPSQGIVVIRKAVSMAS